MDFFRRQPKLSTTERRAAIESRFSQLQAVTREETQELEADGRVSVSEHYWEEDDWGLEIKPSRAGAAPVFINLGVDDVVVNVGHGSFELWREEDWLDTVRTSICAARDGGYWEEIKHGRLFFKVRMHVTRELSASSSGPMHQEEVEIPGDGERRFEPW